MIRKADAVLLAALAALLFACGSADDGHVQGTAPEPRKAEAGVAAAPRDGAMLYADQDRDGRVTRDEAKVDPYLLASFDRYDDDASGALERAEFARLETDALQRAQQTAVHEHHPARPRREFARPQE